MSLYAIGLGSNLGDRLETLKGAVSAFAEAGEVVAVSGLYETDPVGGPEQGRFLNAVILVEVDQEPLALIQFAHRLELAAERVREGRWGPRTLDVDIVVWEEGSFTESGLEIPHPRAHERAFVLRPLVDVWSDAVLGNGLTAAKNLEGMEMAGVELVEDLWI